MPCRPSATTIIKDRRLPRRLTRDVMSSHVKASEQTPKLPPNTRTISTGGPSSCHNCNLALGRSEATVNSNCLPGYGLSGNCPFFFGWRLFVHTFVMLLHTVDKTSHKVPSNSAIQLLKDTLSVSGYRSCPG